MDSGMACLDGLTVGSDSSGTGFSSLLNRSSDPETVKQQKWLGASPTGLEKQERSAAVVGEDDFWMMRSSKVMKSDEYDFSSSTSASKAMMLFQQQRNNNYYYYNNYNNNNNNTLLRSDGMPQNQMLNFSEACNRNAGYSYGSMSCGSSMNSGGLRGVRGPFTPSQWMELEHQALIYKYITANVPVPSNLLIPIEKAFESAGIFCAFSGGLLGPNTLGWGSSFHLGLSNSSDPEPGRCRRTDGKKWRCSRDAVADQKYCERHMNRGRHRSRKPVEGPPGHSVTGNNPTTTNMHKPTRSPSSAAAGVAPTATTTPLPRQHQISYRPEQHSRTDFGIVSSESLLNPSRKSSELETESQQQQQQHSLRQFMDDWPKTDSSNRPTVSWPEPNDHDQMQSERTELSISIPLAAVPSDFMSSTSSPANDPKLALSPPRLCLREFYGGRIAPISWENSSSPSMGGPLGEVLHQKSNNNNNNNSSSLGSSSASPTGVLQRISAFGSVSNSSAGSSPGAENHQKTQEERASFSCNEDDYHHTHRHFHGSIV